ncbi:hypothetical protein ACKKBG_A34745 [Auxenochlorella protothecoides x Auxenochlorella symbiontica]
MLLMQVTSVGKREEKEPENENRGSPKMWPSNPNPKDWAWKEVGALTATGTVVDWAQKDVRGLGEMEMVVDSAEKEVEGLGVMGPAD